MPPKVAVIILQYNDPSDTLNCLRSLENTDYTNYEVFLVDNASIPSKSDEVSEYASTHFKNKLKFIRNSENLGYSGGNNVGIKYALNAGAEYFLILNNDITVGVDLLRNLVDSAESDDRFGLVGPALDESGRIAYGGRVKWLTPELNHVYSSRDGLCVLGKKDFISGAAMLIKKSVFEKIGLFDEKYFLYFEDADFCLRASHAGFKLAIDANSVVRHSVSASTRHLGSSVLLRYHFRNAHPFNLKNGPLPVKILLPFWSVFVIIKQVLKILLFPARREISRQILLGTADFYFGRFGIINNNGNSKNRN